MQVVILAGGLGTRLQSISKGLPKVLVEVCGKPFLQYQLSWLAQHGLTDVVLCVGYLADQIEAFAGDGRAFGVRIHYAYEGLTLLGTAGALKHAAPLLEEQFCVLNGDSYLPFDPREPIAYFQSQRLMAMMLTYQNRNAHDRSNAKVDGGLVTIYTRQPGVPGLDVIDYGLRMFRKEVLALIPEGKFCDMDMVYQQLVAQRRLAAYMVTEPFYEVGGPAGLARFVEYVQATSLAGALA